MIDFERIEGFDWDAGNALKSAAKPRWSRCFSTSRC